MKLNTLNEGLLKQEMNLF